MKKIVKLTESDLTRLVKKVINENERVYGVDNVKKLYDTLKDDESVYLNDDGDELSGEIVSKIEYVRRMLKTALDKKDWTIVNSAIRYIEIYIS